MGWALMVSRVVTDCVICPPEFGVPSIFRTGMGRAKSWVVSRFCDANLWCMRIPVAPLSMSALQCIMRLCWTISMGIRIEGELLYFENAIYMGLSVSLSVISLESVVSPLSPLFVANLGDPKNPQLI